MAANPTQDGALSILRAEWVRGHLDYQRAAEIVAKAKANGIELRPELVYEVHRIAKAKKGAAPK